MLDPKKTAIPFMDCDLEIIPKIANNGTFKI